MANLVFNPDETWDPSDPEGSQFRPGDYGRTRDGKEWLCVQPTAAFTAKQGVRIDGADNAVGAAPLANGGGNRFGIPRVNIPANMGGWVQTSGAAVGTASAAVGAGQRLSVQAGGRLDDTDSANGNLAGIFSQAAVGQAGDVNVFLFNPHYTGLARNAGG